MRLLQQDLDFVIKEAELKFGLKIQKNIIANVNIVDNNKFNLATSYRKEKQQQTRLKKQSKLEQGDSVMHHINNNSSHNNNNNNNNNNNTNHNSENKTESDEWSNIELDNPFVPQRQRQRQFVEDSIAGDNEFDEKLDRIMDGVDEISQLAQGLHIELDRQNVMLNQVDRGFNRAYVKLKERNKRMKQILETTGGARRWCCIIFLFLILLSLIGYIYHVLAS